MDNVKMTVTDHAYKRLKERLGLSRAAAARMSKTAFEQGIRHGDTNGQLNKYISGQCLRSNKKGNDIRLYGEYVYCFISRKNKDDDEWSATLITVFGVPKNLRSQSIGKQKKKYKKGEI